MLLKDDFYKIVRFEKTGSEFEATIHLDSSHAIYKGHFPGYPVTPGVIQIKILQELIEECTGRLVGLSEIKEVKFLSILDPGVAVVVSCDCQIFTNEIVVTATLTSVDGKEVSEMRTKYEFRQ